MYAWAPKHTHGKLCGPTVPVVYITYTYMYIYIYTSFAYIYTHASPLCVPTGQVREVRKGPSGFTQLTDGRDVKRIQLVLTAEGAGCEMVVEATAKTEVALLG